MTFKLIKAGVAALALLAIPFAAQAADVPIKAPYYKGAPHSVVSYYNWTGFYAGVNAGYGFGTSTWPVASSGHQSRRASWLAARLGYNWQSGAIVYGVEGDFDWSNVKGSVACAGVPARPRAPGSPRSAAGSAMPSTAGCPMSRAAAPSATSKRPRAPNLAWLGASNQLGWTFGAGLEYAFMGNWTAKLEYLYVDLGNFNAAVGR